MRKIWFTTDDYGDLIRFVVTASGVRFWYPAVDKKVHALFASWGDVDEWGSPKERTHEIQNTRAVVSADRAR